MRGRRAAHLILYISTTPLSTGYEVSRMTPERVKRVPQAGQRQSGKASQSQRRTSGSVGSFFWRSEAEAVEEGVRQEAEREMMMQAPPGPALKVIQTEFLL